MTTLQQDCFVLRAAQLKVLIAEQSIDLID
jgi:hypothetical protein